MVPAGNFLEYPLSVHFHRIVGSFAVVSPDAGTVTVLLMDDLNYAEYAAARPASRLYSSGMISRGTLNFLIVCCVKPETTPGYVGEVVSSGYTRGYTRYHLVLENPDSSASTTVRMKIELIHDGGAVIAYNGEEFAAASTVGFAAVIGVPMIFYMRKSIVRTSTFQEARGLGKITVFPVVSGALAASLTLIGLTLAFLGTLSYGGRLIDGLIASQAEFATPLPSLFGGELSVADVLFPLWLLVILLWMIGFRMASTTGSRLLGSTGVIEGVIPLVMGSTLAVHYWPAPLFFVPILAAGLVGLPQVLGGLYLIRRFQRKT